MVAESFDQVLVYGFGLFFVFVIIVWQILRYSNRQITEKMNEMKKNYTSEITRLDQEMRKMVLIHAREQKEIREQLGALKSEAEHHHNRNHSTKKIKAVAKQS